MTERTLHFASKGFRTQLVEIAPEPTESKSKRYGLIEEEDLSLNRNLGELEESTKARNRAFQQRIDEIWALTDVWEAKLRTEAREAVETITNQRVEYQKYLDDFNAQLQLEIKIAYDRIDNELIPAQVARHKKVGEELAYFVEKVAPVEIDKTSGEVKRQLKKLYEMFQMGQQKEFIREQKFVKSVNRHIQSTAQRFTDEKSLQIACFFNLEDDVVEHERRAARMHLYRWTRCVDNVVNLKEEIDTESHVRNTEDAILLDTIVDTQQLLQVHTDVYHQYMFIFLPLSLQPIILGQDTLIPTDNLSYTLPCIFILYRPCIGHTCSLLSYPTLPLIIYHIHHPSSSFIFPYFLPSFFRIHSKRYWNILVEKMMMDQPPFLPPKNSTIVWQELNQKEGGVVRREEMEIET